MGVEVNDELVINDNLALKVKYCDYFADWLYLRADIAVVCWLIPGGTLILVFSINQARWQSGNTLASHL